MPILLKAILLWMMPSSMGIQSQTDNPLEATLGRPLVEGFVIGKHGALIG